MLNTICHLAFSWYLSSRWVSYTIGMLDFIFSSLKWLLIVFIVGSSRKIELLISGCVTSSIPNFISTMISPKLSKAECQYLDSSKGTCIISKFSTDWTFDRRILVSRVLVSFLFRVLFKNKIQTYHIWRKNYNQS